MRKSTTIDAESVARPGGGFMTRLVQMPRIARIGIAILFAVTVTLLVTPIVDAIYTTRFFDFNTRMLPALVSALIGVAAYGIGWVLFIGFAGELPQPRRLLVVYFLTGCVLVLVALVLIVTGALDIAQ